MAYMHLHQCRGLMRRIRQSAKNDSSLLLPGAEMNLDVLCFNGNNVTERICIKFVAVSVLINNNSSV